MKQLASFFLIIMLFAFTPLQAQNQMCVVCHKSFKTCPYKGKHPKTTAPVTANRNNTAKNAKPKPVVSISAPTDMVNGHGYVDLALPSGTKWATVNIGASSPSDFGDYFAWGETNTKNDYWWNTYKYCEASLYNLTKYCLNSDRGKVDNKKTLEPDDDVVHVKWGAQWRMPTKSDFEELINNCTWKWTSIHGVKGYMVIGKNNKAIFLPATYDRSGTNGKNMFTDIEGFYWSSSLYDETTFSYAAYEIRFYSQKIYITYGDRCVGHSIRAVCR